MSVELKDSLNFNLPSDPHFEYLCHRILSWSKLFHNVHNYLKYLLYAPYLVVNWIGYIFWPDRWNIFSSSRIGEKIEHLGDRIQNILGLDFEVTSIVNKGEASFMEKKLILRDHGSQWQPIGVREDKVYLEMYWSMRQTQFSETTKVLLTELVKQGSQGLNSEIEVTIRV